MTHSSPEQFLGFMLGTVYRGVSNQFARILKPYDITPEQWSVLFTIAGHEGINQKEVAAAVHKDQPTIARIIELLLKKKYVTKLTSTNDRRAFILYPTKEGKELIDCTVPLEQANEIAVLKGLQPEQVQMLRDLLKKVQHNTENMHRE